MAKSEARLVALIGHLLRDHRRRADLRQEDLALGCGVHQGVVSRWERGMVAPSIFELAAAEAALGLDKGQLFVEAGLVDPTHLELAIDGAINLTDRQRQFLRDGYDAVRGRMVTLPHNGVGSRGGGAGSISPR